MALVRESAGGTKVELIKHHFNKTGSMLPGQSSLSGFASIVSNRKSEKLLGLTFRSFRSPGLEHAPADEARSFQAPASFRLRTGEAASGLRLVYKMYGQLNAEKSNCILHPTSFDATHPELEFNIGPGKTLDTSKFCVIIINLLGNGLSTSPCSHLGKDHEQFPQGGTTMCDNVRLQALLLDSLGVTSLALVYGYSMGAMQALHWAAIFPNRVKRVAAVCGSAQPSDFNITFLDSLEAALLADSDCKVDGRLGMRLHGSCQRGLKAFARIYAGWGVSREFYRQEIWRKTSRDGQPFSSREDFVRRSYEGGFVNASPLNLLAQIRTWRPVFACLAPVPELSVMLQLAMCINRAQPSLSKPSHSLSHLSKTPLYAKTDTWREQRQKRSHIRSRIKAGRSLPLSSGVVTYAKLMECHAGFR